MLDGHKLERCVRVRDLGVILDTKLTFADHVDTTMAKANRMLGLLMRSMQSAPRVRNKELDHRAVLCAYKAHVLSVIEYGGVIWSGAAKTHMVRFERLQHRFLMWLGARCSTRCPMDYQSLLEHFRCSSVRSRMAQIDVMFLRSVLGGRVDCPNAVSMFSLAVPSRRTRNARLFHVPFGRVETVKMGF